MAKSLQEQQDSLFWNLIAESNSKTIECLDRYDVEKHTEELTKLLARLSKEDIIVYEMMMQEKLHELYKASVAELFVIIVNEIFSKKEDEVEFDEFLSDDEFIYFRCWIILQGREVFENVKKDITSFLKYVDILNINDWWGENLLYVGDCAYELKEGIEDSSEIRDSISELYPEVIHYDSLDREMDREILKNKALTDKYRDLISAILKVRKYTF
ncbi:DUF4240 domain-containing protein [Myroides injenensis]|uniref:DUF4240 domain-containing protein n=1 Tax=Myroides injenensis TaxID=1183151 RepID=UPI002271134F|nr:DUF4240 domain-containing protein [Myroides injenensis]